MVPKEENFKRVAKVTARKEQYLLASLFDLCHFILLLSSSLFYVVHKQFS